MIEWKITLSHIVKASRLYPFETRSREKSKDVGRKLQSNKHIGFHEHVFFITPLAQETDPFSLPSQEQIAPAGLLAVAAEQDMIAAARGSS